MNSFCETSVSGSHNGAINMKNVARRNPEVTENHARLEGIVM